MAGAYNLYVNLQSSTGGLVAGLRAASGQLRAFDGQLAGTGNALGRLESASQRLGRVQLAASAEAIRAQAEVTAATERVTAAQEQATVAAERAGRAQALAARTAARAQMEQSAAAQAAATRAQALSTRLAASQMAAEERSAQALRSRIAAETAASQQATQAALAVRRAEADAAAEAQAASQARIGGLVKTGMAIGAVLGVGAAAAIQLEKHMANVETISRQINASTLSAFTDQIVKMSTELPQSTTQLAEGLYQIVSTGFDGAQAMDILHTSAQGAAAGLTTTETSARALLGVLKAYGMPASQASDVMDVMFQTVNLGVVSFEELAQQLGDVVPMAAAAGVKFDDVSSALAAITLAGIPSAEAATSLNMLMTRMMAPTQNLKDAIKGLGYESAASAVQQDGLYVVINKLNGVTHGSAEAITKMFTDVRAVRGFLALSAADGANYASTYKGISNAIERAGATQRAYDLQIHTTSGQWSLFVNQAKALGIDLGRALLPALQAIGSAMNIFAGALNDLPGPVKTLMGVLLALGAAGLIARGAFLKITQQVGLFRTEMAAAREGASLFPAVLRGAGLAVGGLTALLTIGVGIYAAYSASKQKAKQATDELVQALKSEREEGEQGAGLRTLTEQLVGSDDAKALAAVGVNLKQAIDAITTGGAAYKKVRQDLETRRSASFETLPGAPLPIYDTRFDTALKALDNQHSRWSGAVKEEAQIASAMAIVNAKIAGDHQEFAKVWSLDMLVPTDKQGVPQFTDDMTALAKAIGDVVDPAKAWQDAQDKVAKANEKAGKSADKAKVSLADYMDQLRKQAKAQQDFQHNLSQLALAGYGNLTGHFAELGVSAAPILDELVGQLQKGKPKVADELSSILEESSARSQDTFKAGLDQLPGIAARYGKKVAQAWADASETNDPGKLGKVMSQMAVIDMSKAAKASSKAATTQLSKGMDLLADVAREKGTQAADALKHALLTGDTKTAMATLQAIWGSEPPISAPDLTKVTGAFKTAGGQANTQWSAMLDLIAQVAKTKGTAAASALTSALLSGDMKAVETQLNNIGASVREIPGSHQISVTVNVNAPKQVNIPVVLTPKGRSSFGQSNSPFANPNQADGSVMSFFADGGMPREQHVAQIAPAGSWRVWAEPETAGEAYIPLAVAKRARSKAILDQVARQFGGAVVYHADGGLSDWSYDPQDAPEMESGSSIRSRSTRKTKKGDDVFDLALFEKNLHSAASAAARWRGDLGTVARKAGQDVADALEAMGEDGVELTHKMATGSSKYVKSMAADLEKLAGTAKATLAGFTGALGTASKATSSFQANLAKLAGEGYGDLAVRLASQGDEAAQQLAAQAVKDKTAASKANAASKTASATLSDDDLADLLSIIGAIKGKTTGIHAVADSTQLGEDRIIEVANAGKARLSAALGSRAAQFLADLARANKGQSYADGGIRAGLYAAAGGIIRFAEPSTGGEAYIPLGSGKRAPATAVLQDVADRFGYQLTPHGVTGPMRLVDAKPAGATQVVVVREQASALVGSMPITVHGADASPQQISGEIMRRLRNAQRGGRI